MSKIYIIPIILFVSLICANYTFGQRLIIERSESKVLVERENLVKAKKDSLKDAKIQVILQAVARFIDYESMIAIEPLLKKYFLEKPDIFIESIRIIKEVNSTDLSEFSIQIETQIYKSKILSAIRNLGIPNIKEKTPPRKVLLIYNANSDLRKKRVLPKLMKNLKNRLNPYRIKAKFIDTKNKFLPVESGLKARLEYLTNSNLDDIHSNNLALLELKIQLLPKQSKLEKGEIDAQLIFWPHNQESYESNNNLLDININVAYKTWNEEQIIQEILDLLMLKWTPIILKSIDTNEGIGKDLTINFFGIHGPNEEQVLYKTLFQDNSNWKEIFLDKISLNSVSYKGIFIGNQKDILKSFNTSNESTFKILNSFKDKNQLFIKTKWRESYLNLERNKNFIEENNIIENNSEEEVTSKPIFKVPLSTFKKTYRLPFSSPVLDNIRHRGDSTLFRIDWPQKKYSNINGMVLKILWQRIGPSNLSPKITLLDKNKTSIKSFYTGKKKQVTFEHQLPKDRNIYYIRISDEIGFLEDVAGSYQSFKYILTVKQI